MEDKIKKENRKIIGIFILFNILWVFFLNFIVDGKPGDRVREEFNLPKYTKIIHGEKSELLNDLIDAHDFPEDWGFSKSFVYQGSQTPSEANGYNTFGVSCSLYGKYMTYDVIVFHWIDVYLSEENSQQWVKQFIDNYESYEYTQYTFLPTVEANHRDIPIYCSNSSIINTNDKYLPNGTDCRFKIYSGSIVETFAFWVEDEIAKDDLTNMLNDLVVLMD